MSYSAYVSLSSPATAAAATTAAAAATTTATTAAATTAAAAVAAAATTAAAAVAAAAAEVESASLSRGLCLVLACSKESYRVEREAQWSTGLSQLADRMRIVYVFGSSAQEPVIPPHPNVCVWIAPCGDQYEDIPMKMYHGFRLAREMDAEFVLKLDETTRLPNPALLLDVVETEVRAKNYVALKGIGNPGVARPDLMRISFYHSTKVSNPMLRCMPAVLSRIPYARGSAYAVSRRSLEGLSRGVFQTMLYEDYAVGHALFRLGISPHESTVSSLISDPSEARYSPFATLSDSMVSQDPRAGLEAAIRRCESPQRTCWMNITGGFGNQMFQLATGFAYSRDHDRTLRLCAPPQNERPYYWKSLLSRVAPLASGPMALVTYSEPAFSYRPLPVGEDAGFKGYFQSSRYFPGLRTFLRSLLTFPADARARIGARYGALFSEPCVLVHARRGDYVGKPDFHALLGADYYEAAKAEIEKTVASPRYILISDDPSVWKEITCFGAEAVLFDESEDLTVYLMIHCRHFIIANSTFSWWGAYLSGSDHVVAPRRWFGLEGPKDTEDLYESKWIVLPSATGPAPSGRGA